MTNNPIVPQAELEGLKQKISELENELHKIQGAFNVNEKRHKIAMNFSDVTLFDYDIKTKKIITQEEDFDIYGMPQILEHGVEQVINSGIITERSKNDLRELYGKIDNGAASASTTIYANDLYGMERTLFLQMVSVLDEKGDPAYAVGVRKDITDSVKFRKEKEYGHLWTSQLTFIYEANASQNKILQYDLIWAQDAHIGGMITHSELLRFLCKTRISPEDGKLFLEKQSLESILPAFQRGERTISFEYRRIANGNEPIWFEARVNLVQDEITKDINMRVYILNIDSKKKGEAKIEAEQTRYKLALSKASMAYEANISKRTLIFGHDEIQKEFGVSAMEIHTENMLPFILKTVHPHEKDIVAAFLSQVAILTAYDAGQTTLTCEYRKIDNSGQYIWHHCSMQLLKDPSSSNIIAYVYVENIHEEKERELALLYQAEHDLMTGFYNKNTIKKKVDEILSSNPGQIETHIFFIIDLDYFKLVNDKFGHAFGDAVLSQTSAKISALFRSDDIAGRIGGDEFVIFMKNAHSDRLAFLKAQEICDNAAEVYVQDGIEYKVTLSVGIAIYGKHGQTYDELYRNSDAALYEAKQQGRNRFSMYHPGLRFDSTVVNSIDQRQIVETKTFESNISEYVFRILYESLDKRQAINAVLELIGKHYHVSRVYVFENFDDDACARNTFEWCNRSIESQIKTMNEISYKDLGDYKLNFNSEGIFYLANGNAMPASVRKILEGRSVKSVLQFSILRDGIFSGFIGLEDCICFRPLENTTLNDYRNFANILGVFITEMRAFEKIKTAQHIALSVVNGLDSCAYVCDPLSYKLLFVNDATLKFSPHVKIGDYCYQTFWNNDAPCADCPMQALAAGGNARYAKIVYNEHSKIWSKITTSWVDWMEDKKGCLVNLIDITEFQAGRN